MNRVHQQTIYMPAMGRDVPAARISILPAASMLGDAVLIIVVLLRSKGGILCGSACHHDVVYEYLIMRGNESDPLIVLSHALNPNLPLQQPDPYILCYSSSSYISYYI